LCLLVVGAVASMTAPAAAQSCSRVVIFTLPGVVWEDVLRSEPPNLLALADEGAVGSVAVRTNSSRTSYASGFATIGAGTRADGGTAAGGVVSDDGGSPDASSPDATGGPVLEEDVVAAGLAEMLEIAETADYHARPGALASAYTVGPSIAIGNGDPGSPPPAPQGYGRWALLTAMDRSGVTDLAAVGPSLLQPAPGYPFEVRTDPDALATAIDAAMEEPCGLTTIEQGDLVRADMEGLARGVPPSGDRAAALLAADEALGRVADALDPARDLLLVVSPTSPWWDEDVHLGVTIVRGPGFEAGTSVRSASTRQDGIVTLPDIAPTILEHAGIERPDVMIGRSIVAIAADHPASERIDAAVSLDRESVFAHGLQADISTGFVIFQIVIYLLAIVVFRRRARGESEGGRLGAALAFGGLAVVGFPLTTYLASPLTAHELGTFGYVSVLIGLDVALVAVLNAVLRDPLERLLALTSGTLLIFFVDLVLGVGLQLNAVFGNDPIVAGRFSGLGNIAFAVLGTSALMTGALVVHRWPDRPWVFAAVAAMFGATVVVDGAPQLGSDVGGVIALVPVLGITWVLLTGRRPTLRIVIAAALGAVVVLGLFLAWDLSRPEDSRTHLGRLFEDIQARGLGVFWDTVERKITTNLRVFRSTIWTYLVPPALGVIGALLVWPRGRWRDLAIRYPKLRAGLIGGLLLGVTGFAVNDSGIVVPAMVLSFLVPMSLLIHLRLEDDDSIVSRP
jgi:hypothetical protein